eukprot:TRINITY_DN48714_c0_g1_i1.p1 TRINITY_DN48714_c0_g1~~TRINITY_DN48714_c0_g1_i1.p1  ORF type:complete len:323 (-),score=47.92 TRINITY_DN48714_c0_g1_i1:117-1085(-)
MLLMPSVYRWHVPAYEPWQHVAASARKLRDLRGTPGLVVFDRGGVDGKEATWFQEQLETMGLTVIYPDIARRRHGIAHLQKVPRSAQRSYFSDHIPELAAADYVVLVNAKPSAGQLIAEAGLLGVLAIGSSHKQFNRLIFPPEAHANSLAEALERIKAFEQQPSRSALIRAVARGRAERTLGSKGPPLSAYMRVLASLRLPRGFRSRRHRALSSLCNLPNSSAVDVPSSAGFWRLASSRSCGAGSLELDAGARDPSPKACAKRCQRLRGRVFVFDEVTQMCQAYSRCVLALPVHWSSDVFLLDGAEVGSPGEPPAVALFPDT